MKRKRPMRSDNLLNIAPIMKRLQKKENIVVSNKPPEKL
jgi:hypothetical protein